MRIRPRPPARPKRKRKRLGEPPHRMRELKHAMARFTPAAMARVDALAQMLDLPVYLVVDRAWSLYWERLSPEQKSAAEAILSLAAPPVRS